MKLGDEIEEGDLVVAVRDIVDPGIIFNTVLVPKGCPGIVIAARRGGWFTKTRFFVGFRNDAKIEVDARDLAGVSADE